MPQPELVLEATAYTLDQLLSLDVPQIALAGRSNVGKSSLINALASRKSLAKVSSTPGKTRSVNYYRVLPWKFFLVDLPGYGYARASKDEQRKWQKLLEHYLKECQQLEALALLLDSRLPPQKIDLQLVDYARSIELPILPILTKADKCKQRDLANIANQWQDILGVHPVITSSAKRFGLPTLWQAIHDIMETDTNSPAQEADAPDAGTD